MLDQAHELLPLLGSLAALAFLYAHVRAGRPRLPHASDVTLSVFCEHCNWEGSVSRDDARCPDCHSREMFVLSV